MEIIIYRNGAAALFIFALITASCRGETEIHMPQERGDVPESVWEEWDRSPAMKSIFFEKSAPKNDIPNAVNYDIPVAPGISIGARMHQFNPDRPSILYFHGNGEIIHDYESLAGIYSQIGLNFFIVDYRAYGWSRGSPSLRSLHEDALKASAFFLKIIGPEAVGKNAPLVMGRSLGGSPASLVAERFSDRFSGLILESAYADPIPVIAKLRISPDPETAEKLRRALSVNARLLNLKLPVLILHGSDDRLIEARHAHANYETIKHKNKYLKIIQNARHNSIMSINPNEYFQSIDNFLSKTRAPGQS